VTKDQSEQLIDAANGKSGGGLEIKLGGDPIHAAEGQASPEGLDAGFCERRGVRLPPATHLLARETDRR
jgi:hypothetical protein